jgi:hypothetical protein
MLLVTTLTLAACNVGATPAPTVDVNAINTAAVATAMGQISAQLTQTALAAPSNTPASTPTNTPIPLAALPTTGPGTTAATAGASGALPTLSFNTTPNTTPIAGFTAAAGSPVAPVNTAPALGDACHNSIYIEDVTIPDETVLKPGEDFDKIWRIQNTGTCTWDDGYRLVFVAGDQALDPVNYEIKDAADFVEAGETVDMGVDLTAPNAEGKYSGTWRMQTDAGVFFGTPLTVVINVKK